MILPSLSCVQIDAVDDNEKDSSHLWERNQTSNEPVFEISIDNSNNAWTGSEFLTNGAIGSSTGGGRWVWSSSS